MARKALPSKVKPGTSKLSADERRAAFVEHYLLNGENGSKAALAAGYSKSGAGVQANRMLKDPKVLALIERRRFESRSALEITTDRVLQERARLAFFDPRKLFNPDGSPKPIQDLDDDTAAAIAGLEVMEVWEGAGEDRRFVGYLKKIKISNKADSLTALEKHLGLYEKDNQQKNNPLEGLPRELLQAMVQRLKAMNHGGQ